MAWDSSNRREELPDNWDELRREVIRRAGGRCEWRLPRSKRRCPRKGTDVDHFGSKHDHSKLRLLCADHHADHTARQAREARAQQRQRRYRPSEEHPGGLR
jgi:hypothetical protein